MVVGGGITESGGMEEGKTNNKNTTTGVSTRRREIDREGGVVLHERGNHYL
jgi:hypothetical protein